MIAAIAGVGHNAVSDTRHRLERQGQIPAISRYARIKRPPSPAHTVLTCSFACRRVTGPAGAAERRPFARNGGGRAAEPGYCTVGSASAVTFTSGPLARYRSGRPGMP
jgi:hypothetical protein